MVRGNFLVMFLDGSFQDALMEEINSRWHDLVRAVTVWLVGQAGAEKEAA